jgi:dienelactone hydrolase
MTLPIFATQCRNLTLVLGIFATISPLPQGARAFAPLAPEAGIAQINLVDTARDRKIPVMLYGYMTGDRPRRVAIISHGLGTRNTAYSFLADALVQQGYVVAAIQHELDEDAPLAMGDNLYVRRYPNWQAGVENIMFTVRALRERGIANGRKIVLVGHSNGGDMSMLFAWQHPEMTRLAFSFDNRRMYLPRMRDPRICSVRSIDQPADPYVLPSADEQRTLHIRITSISGLKHNFMSNRATTEQKKQMLDRLFECLPRSLFDW